MKKRIAGLVLAALIATTALAQGRGQRVSAECRQEIVALCRSSAAEGRGAMRTCLLEKRDQISEGCRSELRQRMQDRGSQTSLSGSQELSYGEHERQTLDFWAANDRSAAAPLILYVHGGGWAIGDKRQASGSKPQFYTAQGFAFAATNYRLVPKVTPADQAHDIATAVARLRARAGKLGFDPDRIVLMGHSAGAHLAALVSTDPRYLREAGVPLSAVRGAILLDGAGYDVPAQMGSGLNRVQSMYEAAFTRDVATQKALSPLTHAAAPNAARWLILYVERRNDARVQASRLGEALKKAGDFADIVAVPGSTHMTVNRDAGVAGTFVANRITGFLRSAL